MSTKIHSKTVNYGIIRQNPTSAAAGAFVNLGGTTNQWTNPSTATTNFRNFYITPGSMIPDPNVVVDDLNYTSQLGLGKEVTNRFVNSTSGLKRLPFSMIADRNTLAPLLVGALQACVDDAGTPYEKTITDGFKAGTLNFNGGLGYLHSIACKNGASADDGWFMDNVITDSITLTWDFLQPGKGKLVSITGVLVGNALTTDVTHSGTWVATTPITINNSDTFSFNTFTVDSVDVSALCVKRMSWTWNNNVTSNCATSAGKANQYDVNPMCTWSIQMDHNSTTEKFLGDFQAGANVDIDFTNSIGTGTSGHFRIDMPYGRMKANPFGFDGDYLSETLEVEAEQNSTTSRCTVYLADTLAWDYNTP